MRVLMAVAVMAVALAAAPRAEAQSGCRTVEVEAVTLRRVEIFDLRGTPVRTVPRRDLENVTHATECPNAPSFLRVEFGGQRWLVRRTALQLRGADLNLPVCAPGEYESYIERNASSSGAGLPPCRRANN